MRTKRKAKKAYNVNERYREESENGLIRRIKENTKFERRWPHFERVDRYIREKANNVVKRVDQIIHI